MQAIHEELIRLLSAGERVAVATVIRGRGSRPRETGAKMLVLSDGRTFFSIGGGALEACVIADCACALDGGGPATSRYDLSEAGENSVGRPLETFRRRAGGVGLGASACVRRPGFPLRAQEPLFRWI